jgi:hypothetical protein
VANRQNLLKQGTFNSIEALLQDFEDTMSSESLADFMSKNVYPYLRDQSLDRFETEGDETTGKWAALSDASERWRRWDGVGTDDINRRTGKLEEFIRQAVPTIVRGADSAILQYPGGMPGDKYTAQKYRVAQRGQAAGVDKRRQPKTPPRPIVAVGAEEFGVVQSRLEQFIMTGEIL